MDFAAKTRAPLRVLIVRVGAMGDVLHGLPAVGSLREAMPECFIGWAVEPRWAALLTAERASGRGAGMPVVDRVHLVATRKWNERPFSGETLRGIVALRRELRAEEYDVCVDLQGSVRSAAIGWMAGAGRFVGAEEPREWLAREFYAERVQVRARDVIWQACELVGAGLGVALGPKPVEMPVNAEAEGWAARVIGGLPLDPMSQKRDMGHPDFSSVPHIPGSFVLLSPGAGWGAKRWPMGRYAELGRRLAAAGWRVLMNGGRDSGDAEELARGGGAEMVACSVAQLVALTRRATLVIGGDTGPVHLAAGLGRPVVALFGPTDPRRTGPYFPGAKVTVLRNPTSVVSHQRVAETEAGLARISVEEVFAAALAMLDGNGTGDCETWHG